MITAVIAGIFTYIGVLAFGILAFEVVHDNTKKE